MKVSFYFDPSCPWTWLTSRWLVEVSAHREIDVRWRFFSLTLKRDKLDAHDVHPGHQMLRVMAAAESRYDNQTVGRLYTEMGSRWHLGQEYTEAVIEPALKELELDASLIESASDDSLDDTLRQSLNQAVEAAGEDVGSPILSFHLSEGERGFFGPILTELPSHDDCLKLWDTLHQAAEVDDFYEFKRSRNSGPDVSSSQRLDQ